MVSGALSLRREVFRPVGTVSVYDSSEVGCQLLDEDVRVLLRERLKGGEESPHRRVVLGTKL